MPSKKSNSKGKKNVSREPKDAVLPVEQNKENIQHETKPMLKCSNWTQDQNFLDIALFTGLKLKSSDIDAEFEEQKCNLKISDGREWHMHFFKPIEFNSARVQVKGLRINLKIRKKEPGNWLDIAFIPGQSDQPTVAETPENTTADKSHTETLNPQKQQHKTAAKSNDNSSSSAEGSSTSANGSSTSAKSSSTSSAENSSSIPAAAKPNTQTQCVDVTAAAADSSKGDGDCVTSQNDEKQTEDSLPVTAVHGEENEIEEEEIEEKITLPGIGQVIVGGPKPDVSDLLDEESKESQDDGDVEFLQEDEPQKGIVYKLLHIKQDFYEKSILKSNDTIVVQLFVKQMVKESVNVRFQGIHVGVDFQTKDPKFISMHEGTDETTLFSWNIEVVDEVYEPQCRYKITPSYMELTIRKNVASRWCALEAIHTKGKVKASSEWLPASTSSAPTTPNTETPPSTNSNSNNKVPTTKKNSETVQDKSKVIFDEMEDSGGSKTTSDPSTSKGYILGDGGKEYAKKPTCMVSPLKPPKEKQVVTSGYTGLDNLGNTCFMNSILQVLANSGELRDYFLDGHFQKDINTDNPLGTGGKLAVEFAMLLKVLWSGSKYSYAPTNLKKLVAQKKSMFMGFAQHDAQEYMSFLLDGLHEDVNRVKKKPYIEQVDSNERPDEEVAEEFWSNHKLRNDSYLVDLFQGQYKSTLVCPVCDKISVTFDPFMHLPVPLPKKQRLLPVYFVPRDPSRKPVKYMLRIPKEATVEHLKDSIFQKTHVPPQDLRVYEVYQNRIHCMFQKGESLNNVVASDTIIVHEVLSEKLAGEPVRIIPVIQRLHYPTRSMRPTHCAYCRHEVQPNAKLLRCTGCFRVGYCASECQRQHWNDHRRMCQAETIGMPFIISLPQSLATYSRISQLAERYSRYSVDVFQPPQDNSNTSSSPPPSGSSSSSSSSSSKCTQSAPPPSPTTEQADLAAKAIDDNSDEVDSSKSNDKNQTVAQDNNQLMDNVSLRQYSSVENLSSLTNDTEDSGRGESLISTDKEDSTGLQGNVMTTSTTSSQDTDSSSIEPTTEAMSVSTSSTSLSTDNEDSTGHMEDNAAENNKSAGDTSNDTPTRAVIGQQKDAEKPAPQFNLVPLHKMAVTIRGKKKLEDSGDEPVCLDKDEYIGLDWKNSDKDVPYVQVQTKQFEYIEDPSTHNVLLEENKNITLEQCLCLFTEPEVLSAEEAWYCPRCKEHREASKQLSYWRLPKILIIQLKRFSYRNLLWCDKVDKFVEFPVRGLDMTPYYEGKVPDGEPQPTYDLYGVVNHYGGIMGGHYTAFTRCVNTADPSRNELGWRCCDDSHVTNCSENQVVTSAAYVLFYRRREPTLELTSAAAADSNSIHSNMTENSNINNKNNESSSDDDDSDDEERPIFTISPKSADMLEDRNLNRNLFGVSSIYGDSKNDSLGYSAAETARMIQRRNENLNNEFMPESKCTIQEIEDADSAKLYSDMDTVD